MMWNPPYRSIKPLPPFTILFLVMTFLISEKIRNLRYDDPNFPHANNCEMAGHVGFQQNSESTIMMIQNSHITNKISSK